MFFFVWFLIPETKGLSLERMDDLFGVTELVKNVEADRERQASVGTGHGAGEARELGMDGKEVSTVERKEVAG